MTQDVSAPGDGGAAAPLDQTGPGTGAEEAVADTAPAGDVPREAEGRGAATTAAGTAAGLESPAPVGVQSGRLRAWVRAVAGPPRSKFGLAAAPLGIGASGAVAYAWWRRRQARRSRLARLRRRLAGAGGAAAPVLAAARERRGLWPLAALAALPLAFALRSVTRTSRGAGPAPVLGPTPTRRDRLSSVPPALLTAAGRPLFARVLVPLAAAGAVGVWRAARRGGRGVSGAEPRQLREIMTRAVEVVGPEATLAEAAAAMRRRGVGFLPVCDGRRLEGTLTDRDIVVRAVAEGRDPRLATVREALSSEVAFAFEDDAVERAAALMRRHRIRRLPIVDRARNLVGVVSLGDLAVETGDERLGGATLEQISEPARPSE